MRKFSYTSKHIVGEVILGFSDLNEGLVFLDLSQAELTTDQHGSFLRNIPLILEDVKLLVLKDKNNRQLTEIVQVITFDMFWEKYDHKTLSHKQKSLAIWSKMSEAERQKAFDFIAKYNYQVMKDGIGKKHAQTYLNVKLWNN